MGASLLEAQLPCLCKPWLFCSDRGKDPSGKEGTSNRFSTCRKATEQEKAIQGCFSAIINNILFLLLISGRKACLVFCCGF